MGKRLDVQRRKIPKLSVGKLKQASETQYKILGIFVPLIIYVLLAFVALKLSPAVGGTLVCWLVLGWVFVLVAAGSHKSQLIKAHPRSKVGGSGHTDVRMALSRLCRLLDIKKVPECYVIETQQLAASVRGMGGPYLILSSRLQQVLTPREFEALLSSLLGHVKAGNVTLRTFVHTAREAPAITKVIIAPYLLPALLMGGYLEASRHSADRVGLLLLDGDVELLSETIIKVIARTSESLSEDQIRRLDAFLHKSGMEASAVDVELSMLLDTMMRKIPGLKERLDDIRRAPHDPKFEEQLAVMRERVEKLQPASVV